MFSTFFLVKSKLLKIVVFSQIFFKFQVRRIVSSTPWNPRRIWRPNWLYLWHLQQASFGILRSWTCPNHDWWCQYSVRRGSWTPKEAWRVKWTSRGLVLFRSDHPKSSVSQESYNNCNYTIFAHPVPKDHNQLSLVFSNTNKNEVRFYSKLDEIVWLLYELGNKSHRKTNQNCSIISLELCFIEV